MRRGSQVRSWSRVATVGDTAYRCGMMSRVLIAQPPEAEAGPAIGVKAEKPRKITRDELAKTVNILVSEAQPAQLREFARVLKHRMQAGGKEVKDLNLLKDGRFLLNPKIISTTNMRKALGDVITTHFKSDQARILKNSWEHLGLGDVYLEQPKKAKGGGFSVVERGVSERERRMEERGRAKKKKEPAELFGDSLKAFAEKYGRETKREDLAVVTQEVIAKTKADKLADEMTDVQVAELAKLATDVIVGATSNEARAYQALLLVNVLAKVFTDVVEFQGKLDGLTKNLKRQYDKNKRFLSKEGMPKDLVETFTRKKASEDDVLLSVVQERAWRKHA